MRKGYAKKEGIMAYNDYELLYLSHLNDEDAIDIIIKKYEPLIHKMISNFNVDNLNKEDYLQEGRLVINKAIKSFNEESKMTFTKYLEMLLYHRFIDLVRKKKKCEYDLLEVDTIEYLYEDSNKKSNLYENIDIKYEMLSDFEKEVFHYKYIIGKSSKEISEILNIPIKKIYSATERIVKKRKSIVIK